MTSKERWLAAIAMKPVDRLPFWPKLDGKYPQVQGGRFQGMTAAEVHEWIGSDRHEWTAPCIRETRRRTSIKNASDGKESRTVYETPDGSLEMLCLFDEASNSWHPVKFPVETAKDIPLMTQIFDDLSAGLDSAQLEEASRTYKATGDKAIIGAGIGESPLMHWVEWVAGVENAHYLLADESEKVEALFQAMHRSLLEKTRIACEHCPADILYLVENTSTTLISPEQYRKYCLRHIMEYAEIAKSRGRSMVLHMCGHLKDILPDLAKLPVRAFEAFTSPTVGNTTLLEGRNACPRTCLIGGTNATTWLKSPDEIKAEIKRSLDELPHHRGVVVTSAGVMPPLCKPETIKEVCEWVKEYEVRN